MTARNRAWQHLSDPGYTIFVVLAVVRAVAALGLVLRFSTHPSELDRAVFGFPTYSIFYLTLVSYFFASILNWVLARSRTPCGYNDDHYAFLEVYPVYRKVDTWIQLTLDFLFLSISYALTMEPESDIFLLYFIPLLTGSLFLSFRNTLGIVSMFVICFLLALSAMMFRWSAFYGPDFPPPSLSRLALNISGLRLSLGSAVCFGIAWLIQRLQRLQTKRRRYLELMGRLLSSSSIEHVTETLLDGLGAIYGRARLWRLSEQTRQLVATGARGPHNRADAILLSQLALSPNNITGLRVLNENRAMLFCYRPRWYHFPYRVDFEAIAPNEDEMRDLLDKTQIQEWVEVPVASSNARIGKLTIDTAPANIPFHAADLRLLNSIAETTRGVLDRIEAMRSLNDSVRFHRELLESLPINIFHKDTKGQFIYMNERCLRMMGGLKSADVIGKTDASFFPDWLARQYAADDREVVESGRIKEIPEESFVYNGMNISIHTVKAPLRKPDGSIRGLIGFFTELTTREQTEKRLQEDRRRLLRWFLHDTPKPLIIIRDSYAIDIPEMTSPIDVKEACVTIARLIDCTLAGFYAYGFLGDSSKFRWEPSAEPIGIQDIIETVLLVFESDNPSVDFPVRIDPSGLSCRIDRFKVMAIISLLVDNALQAIERAPNCSAPALTIEARLAGGQFVVEVLDNGCGLAPDWQIAEGRSTFDSTGLGLSIVLGLVGLVSGDVFYENRPEGGAAFRVRIPLPD